LVLIDQAKRTLINVTVGRACLPARQGFTALDSAYGGQVFGSFPSSGTSRPQRRGEKNNHITDKWDANTRVAGKESE
jgi:hypothetical protein